MPSSTTKQAKVMSAIAHGWKPKGSAAKIPVKVAKEFHAADKGHKYGRGMHHKKGDREKVHAALHTARKYNKKADGGDVDEDDRPALPNGDKQPVGPDWSKYNQPMGELKPASYSPTQQIGNMAQDAMIAAGADPYVAGHLAEGVGNIIKASPLAVPGAAADYAYAKGQGDTSGQIQAALGFIPGVKAAKGFTKAGAEIADQIHDTVLGASSWPLAMHPAGGAVAKQLKSFYPKDIAQSAFYLGISPQEIEGNLKSYMSPGAIEKFDKHYTKLMPKTQVWSDPEWEKKFQDDFHKAALAQKGEIYPSGGGPSLEELHGEPYTRNNPNEFARKPYDPVLGMEHPEDDFAQEPFRPDDQSEYEAAQARHQSHEQAINEGNLEETTDVKEPQNVLPQALSPTDLEEKSAKLGLNTTAFHGTRTGFSEFKLPEELGFFPELGVHFGTLRAAIDRAGSHLHPLERQGIEDNLRQNQKYIRDSLAILPNLPGNEGTFKIIPARIGANNPLHINSDLGTWGPSKIMFALLEHPEFNANEVSAAFNNVKTQSPKDSFAAEKERATQQIQNLRKLIESHGYDSMSYRNNVEDPGSLSYIIWDLNKARSFYAKFDPAKAGSRNLGAAIAGASIVPLGLYQGQGEPEQKAEGGKVRHKQIDEDPQDHEFIDFSRGGLIDSDIPGRTDKIPMKVPPGSFVLPADIPSALGQGNTKAGAEILKKMFTHGAYGLPPPHIHGQQFHFPSHFSMREPSARTHHRAEGGKVEEEPVKKSKATVHYGEASTSSRSCGTCKYSYGPTGQRHCWLVEGMIKPDDVCNLWEAGVDRKAEGGSTEHVPVITAGGEFIVHPDVVKHMGNGDMKTGHKLLTKFVLHTRKEHIKTLKGLKPPK